MIKKSLLFLTLFTFASFFGQDNRKMTVIYKLFLEEDKINFKNDDLRNAISLESGNLIFKLFINDSISYFIENNGISTENLPTKLAILKTKYITPIYCKADKSFLFNNSPNFRFFNNNEYLISKKSKSDWVITDESKMIDGNLCYKAITTDIDYGGRDKNEYQITAWFCPKIPFGFGPVYYGNLPGLILEINYLDIKLLATKIEYRLEVNKINKPEGQKLITISDYYSKMSSTINELMKEVENQKKY
jgi:GLPGLI family protein